jgi:DNA polymerase
MPSLTAKTEQLRAIKEEVLNLTILPLYAYRQKEGNLPVIGEGSHEAKIMLVGEAPGKNEAKTGRPFCGSAGRLLDELLASINLPRQAVYITNIVKDRPPGNRDPLPEEIAAYAPWLDRQINIIRPAVIATLGRFSMSYLLPKFGVTDFGAISQAHGKKFVAQADYGPITLVPLYHPAAAIYNQALKATMFADFKILKNL